MTIIRTPMRLSWPRCYIFFLFIVSWVREINAIEHNSEASFSIYDEESQLQNRETSDLCETTECSQRNAAQPAIDIFENVAQLLYEPDRAFLPHINYALIPHSSLSWTQTSGSSLTLVNTYLVSSENHADTIEKMDDDQFTRRLRQMLPYLQNPQNAQLVDRGRAITLSQANVSYSFEPHTPPRDETELYSFERILKLHNSFDHFATLEANISVESTFPQCFGPHLVKIVLVAKYEFRSQPHEPHEALESQEAGTAQWATTYGEHDTLHWMKGAEELTMIYFDATLTEEVQSVQRLVRETTSFYGPIEQVIIRIIITTKCPQAIQINQLLLLMYMPMEIAFEAGEKTKYLLPSSVVSNDSLHPDESTDDERAEPVGMVKVLADGAYIERLVVEPKSTGTFSFVSFYVSPSRIHGSHDWNIWYGTRVHISHSNSVKITLKCPTKVTQLHLQAPTLEELIIHGYDIMTGVFVSDEKEPDTHACDEVLVELTFPRHKSTLTVEDLFFICDGNPCSIRPFLPDDSRNPIPRSPGLSRDSLNPAATSLFRRRGSLLKEARLTPTPILLQQHNIIHATSAKRVSYTTIGIFTLGLLLCCIALIALHRRRRRFLSSARFVALAPKEENELARTDVDIQMIDESVLHS